jgi:hypothetical protein
MEAGFRTELPIAAGVLYIILGPMGLSLDGLLRQ